MQSNNLPGGLPNIQNRSYHGNFPSMLQGRYSPAPPKMANANYIPHWPDGPLQLRISFWNKLTNEFSDICLLVLSLLFAVLGIFILLLRDRSQSSWGDMVLQATKIAPTIWPLVFAAVIGNLLKARASRKLQNGASLGTIEQLMGSQTVFGTIRSAVAFRVFGFSTLVLLVLWSFNPVGGQASLRSLKRDTPTKAMSDVLRYMNLDPLISLRHDVLQGSSSIAYYRPLLASIFGSALYSPEAALQYLTGSDQEVNLTSGMNRLGGPVMAIQKSQQDVWGNVRIPVLHLLRGYSADHADTWTEVPEDEIPSLSSLIGIPLRNAVPVETVLNSANLQRVAPSNNGANITLEIETNYHRFQCSDWEVLDSDQLNMWLEYHNYNISNQPFSVHHGTGFVLGTEGLQTTVSRSRSDLWTNNDTTTQIPARTVWFASKGYPSPDILEPVTSVTYCNISTEYIEVRIKCAYNNIDTATRCTTTHLRPSQNPHLSPNFTELDFSPLSNHLLILATILPEPHPATSSPQEVFMYDPPGAFTNSSYSVTAIQMSHVPIQIFQSRLALLYNTLSTATKAPNLIMGGEFTAPFGGPTIVRATTAEWTYVIDAVYRVHVAWLAVYLFSVGVLCFSAIWTIGIRLRLAIPEILGSVSSLTRDSGFVSLPNAASSLDGDQRVRLLWDMWIRLQDVSPTEEVGRIAVSSDRGLSQVQLERGRFYD